MRIEETYPTQKSGEKMVIRGALMTNGDHSLPFAQQLLFEPK